MSTALTTLQNIRRQFDGGKHNTNELVHTVIELLPDGYDISVDDVRGELQKFKAVLSIKKLETLEDASSFAKKYEEKTNQTLRRETPITHGKKNEFGTSIYYRCHHRTHHQNTMNVDEVLSNNPAKRFKNTGCQFMLNINILNDILCMKRW